MARATAATTKGPSSSKKTTASKPRTRAAQHAEPVQQSELAMTAPATPAVDGTTLILRRLEALEEKITGGFAALTEELRVLRTTPSPAAAEGEALPESALALVADVLRRNLMEHLNPVTAGLKRLEERVGFVANRLKHGGGGGGGQERPKPWRHEQGRHPRPPRGQQNSPRPNPPQPQQWSPPSAASVQGHFAPRPLHGGAFTEEEE